MKEPTRISIDTGTFVRALAVGAAAVLLFLVRDIVLILLVAVVIASAATPGIEALARQTFFSRTPPRALAVALVYAGALVVLVLIVSLVLPVVLREVLVFLGSLPEYSRELSETLGAGPESVMSEELVSNTREAIAAISSDLFGTVSAVFGGLFSAILIITISFYIALQKDGVGKFLAQATPTRHAGYVASLWERSQRKIGLWFRGMLVSSFVVGVFVYIGLLILGLPYAFFLALFAALFNFIPIVGPALSALPAIAIGFAEGGVIIGILVIALYVLVQILEGNVIYPVIVGRAVGVSPIAIILAIGIGAELAGFLGIILAVPVSAVLVEFMQDMRARNAVKNSEEPSLEKERSGSDGEGGVTEENAYDKE